MKKFFLDLIEIYIKSKMARRRYHIVGGVGPHHRGGHKVSGARKTEHRRVEHRRVEHRNVHHRRR